ncbi:MAG: hypothetical protein WBD22_08045 [Pyrinomonadaceae bacterium]
MQSKFTSLRVAILGISILILTLVVSSIFWVERSTDAENPRTDLTAYSEHLADKNREVYLKAFERERAAYSKVNSVNMEAVVAVTIFKANSKVFGEGQIKYVAAGNKYKYATAISDNLVDEGLMRNLEIIYDERKYYLFDEESGILSYQDTEDINLPLALPNPFFLPIDFFGRDDDGCVNCKIRLQDLRAPLDWLEKAESISELSAKSNGGFVHHDIRMLGGVLEKIPYDYLIKFVGTSSDSMRPKSITKIMKDGSNLVSIILNDSRRIDGFEVEVPHSIEVGAHDSSGRVVMTAVFTITNLDINKDPQKSISPDLKKADQIWDSDKRTFVDGIR